MFCMNCGEPLSGKVNFCPHCGHKVDWNVYSAMAAANVPGAPDAENEDTSAPAGDITLGDLSLEVAEPVSRSVGSGDADAPAAEDKSFEISASAAVDKPFESGAPAEDKAFEISAPAAADKPFESGAPAAADKPFEYGASGAASGDTSSYGNYSAGAGSASGDTPSYMNYSAGPTPDMKKDDVEKGASFFAGFAAGSGSGPSDGPSEGPGEEPVNPLGSGPMTLEKVIHIASGFVGFVPLAMVALGIVFGIISGVFSSIFYSGGMWRAFNGFRQVVMVLVMLVSFAAFGGIIYMVASRKVRQDQGVFVTLGVSVLAAIYAVLKVSDTAGFLRFILFVGCTVMGIDLVARLMTFGTALAGGFDLRGSAALLMEKAGFMKDKASAEGAGNRGGADGAAGTWNNGGADGAAGTWNNGGADGAAGTWNNGGADGAAGSWNNNGAYGAADTWNNGGADGANGAWNNNAAYGATGAWNNNGTTDNWNNGAMNGAAGGRTNPPSPYPGQPAPGASYFDGDGIDLFVNILLLSIASAFTCGIAAPWFICRIYKWRLEHTVIDGKRLTFNGTGGELLGRWILWEILSVITCGLFAFYVRVAMKKWELSHTAYMGAPESAGMVYPNSYFDGPFSSYLGYSLLCGLITSITCGIGYPWAAIPVYKWEMGGSVVEGDRLGFYGNGTDMFGIYLVNALLTAVTCGIYSPWATCRINRYIVGNTHVS